MLFHTWPFLVFMLVVLPVFYGLRNTRLWLPWLMVASYYFYGTISSLRSWTTARWTVAPSMSGSG
jgi:hypothetical protein